MPAPEWEPCGVVFEGRWLPLVCVVTRLALFPSITKLIGMWILMTISTFLRGFREIHMTHCQLEVWWLMTVRTRHCTMRSGKWKLGVFMIEPRHVFPLLC